MILFNMKTSSSKIIATLFILFAVYILGCGNSFAVDFTYANDPISIVIYEGEGNTIVRLEMNFNDVSGSLSIVDSSGILLDDYLYDDYFDTYDYSDMTGFSMESWNADLIANILSDTSTLHTLTFPADSLQDGSTYNSNPITIEFYTPVQLDSVTANSGDNFTLDVTVTTPAGTMVAAVAKRFDFEQEYPFNDSYDTLTPQLLSGGFLSEFSGEIVDASNSFAASSGMKTLAGLDLDTPYTVMVYTELPSTSGNNHGSRLFTGTILEGMQYASGETRPVLVTEDAISTYKFNQSDASGYDVYIVLLFQDNIFSDALTASGQPALPYGIDLNVIMQNSEFTSLANQDGTAEIIDNKLILKLQDNIFSDSNTFSLRIPAGTVKNTSGYANEDIEVLTEFTLSDNSMVLNQIKPGSISQNIDSSSNQISMMLTEPGMIFNSFVEGPDFNTSDLFNTTTSVEDTDYEINVPNTLEFLTVPAGDTKVGTTFTNLTPETDYWWITTVHLNDPTKEIMEGQIYHFTTAASPPSMEMQGIEYCTGDTSAVAGDDSVYINFSQSLTNIGSASDYSVYVDYDSDDTLDVTISPSDYTLVQDLQAGMTDNQVRLIFGDEMASALDNIYNAQIKVAVANLTNIEPNVTASGTTYLYVDVPGRCADIHQPALIDSMTSANYPVMDFDVDTVSYTVPILPSDYSSMISNGSMAAFPVDNNASVYPTSDGYGVFSLQVTAETGNIVKTYTATASSDKFLLSDLSVNGTTLPLFTPNGFYDYEIPLPAGTTDLPTVEWALDSPTPPGVDTEMEVTGDLSTEAIVTIYTIDLETNDTIHSYRLLFTTEASVNLNLATLSLSTTEYGEIPFDTMNHTEGTVDFHLPSSLYESILNNSTFVGTAENPTATVTLPTVGAETTVTVTDPVTSSSKTYNVTINSSDKFL
ncbi:MAG: hypothetical protein JXO44_14665, partial [Clostridia bacterium]|nr:hypothetical protein [Clostridia bacterium]